jgi:predicted nucleic acid-binding protein
MAKYLLDTSVLWELLSYNPNNSVQDWIIKQKELELYISPLSLGEIQKFISSMHGSKKKKDLEQWVQEFSERFQERLVPIDTEISRTWGKIRVKYPQIDLIQALILSTAIQNHFILVKCKDWNLECAEVEIRDIST